MHGNVLYHDENIAIVGGLSDEETADDALRMLITLDTESPGLNERIVPLLGLWGVPLLYMPFTITRGEADEVSRTADRAALERLGFHIEDGYVCADSPSDGLKAVSLRQTSHFVTLLSDALGFLARLYLLNGGDLRHEETVRIVDDGNARLLEVPALIAQAADRHLGRLFLNKSDGLVEDCNTEEEAAGLSSPVNSAFTSCNTYGLFDDWEYPRKGMIPYSISDSLMGMESTIVAGVVLSDLLNLLESQKFELDWSYRLIRNPDLSVISRFIDHIMDGLLVGCPHCGKPVLKKYPSSKPFCKASHQTRYRDAATAMYEKGADTDSVHAAYPYINIETIRNW